MYKWKFLQYSLSHIPCNNNPRRAMTKTYQEEFIDFLAQCGALTFGRFKLKSGRIAPYFINTGMFDTGKAIKRLGMYYAKAVMEHFGSGFDGIYGPAYKGIPLCISTATALADQNIDKGYVFNRKEAKTYGDKSAVVGMKLTPDTRLILVDDVITSGKAIRESIDVLKTCGNPSLKGIVVSVNRQEKGISGANALNEISQDLGIPIFSIVTLDDIVGRLSKVPVNGHLVIDNAMLKKVNEYRAQYGSDEKEG